MARRHGLVLASIWSDPDWVALTAAAQRLYILLLSQPKLTLVGALDYMPTRWAHMAADTSLASVEAAIDELEASRFVLVDHDTDELLIRTFVKHDITTVLRNKNLLRGLWNAWDTIQSRQLQLEALRNIPASVWEANGCQPHPEALRIRRSGQLEPTVQTHSPNPQSELPSSLLPPPSTLHPDAAADLKQPVNSRGDGPSEAAANDDSEAGTEPSAFDTAIDLLVTRELDRNPTRNGNRTRHEAAVRRGKVHDHQAAADQILATEPDIDGPALADRLEPPPSPPASARPQRPDIDPDHQAATQARHRRDQARHDADIDAAPRADTTELKAGIAAARAHLRPIAGGQA